MSSGSGSNKQTVTSRTALPRFLDDAYKSTIDAAGQLHDAGSGFNAYPGATYVPPSASELSGLESIRGIAEGGNPLIDPAIAQFQNVLSSGGISPEQRSAIGTFDDIRTGPGISGGADFTKALEGISGPSASREHLEGIARGDFLGSGNPYVGDILQQAAQKAATAANENVARLGREGSNYHSGTISREIGDLYSRGLFDDYNAERQRQLQAAGQIDAADTSRAGAQGGLISGRAGLEGSNIANQFGAARSMFDALGAGQDRALSYAGAIPGISDARYGDARQLISAGAAERGELQSELQSLMDRFNVEDMAEWNRLGLAFNTIGGASQPYFTQTQTTKAPSGSSLATGLGAASSTAGILGALGQGGSSIAPWLTGGAGIAGAFL